MVYKIPKHFRTFIQSTFVWLQAKQIVLHSANKIYVDVIFISKIKEYLNKM